MCLEDEFKDSNSGARCEACTAHSGTNGKLASESVTDCLCDLGYTGTLVDLDSVCTACPADMYKDVKGPFSCTPCPANSNTAGRENRTDVSQCLCDPGYTGSATTGSGFRQL